MVISDNTIIALSHDKAPDKALFETSLKEFLKNDKLNVTVTLYTEKDTFIKRAFSTGIAVLSTRSAVSSLNCCLEIFISI